MTDARSLTQDEARGRAALLVVDRYDVALDLTGLEDGDALRATSRVTFSASTPGASTFVDCLGEVEEAVLNGRSLSTSTPGGRLDLPDLEADNVLVVSSVQRRTGVRQGIQRAVDPGDGEVYVWTDFEPDDARVVFACFDQPDLKAVFGTTVHVPERWLVTSNTGDAEVTTTDGVSTWRYGDTPRLPTYLFVVNAGPMVELRSERGGYDLGLYARRSLANLLEREAEELFDLTARGLAFFGEQFGLPFPQRRYDQVFLHEFSGAMENWGCVNWEDYFIFREPPSYAERELRALVLLHEMAHMWFGDMVTLRWWDDLWLNESFAEWACGYAAVGCTEFTDMWAGMLATEKQDAYDADEGPTTHPIRQVIPDVAAGEGIFDAITYPKGAAVLRQLVAFVGEKAFLTGLRSYFRDHQWGNTTLDDLISALAAASGRDLSGWVHGWLETSGTDRLALEVHADEIALVTTPPAGRGPLPHRLQIGGYAAGPDELSMIEGLSIEVTGERTAFTTDVAADLWLLNDDDLTYATLRPDPASLELMLSRGGHLPTAVGRTLTLTTAWRLLYDGELTAQRFVDCGLHVLPRESADSVIEPMLGRLVEAADHWSPYPTRESLLSQVADLAVELADNAARRVAAVRALAHSATTPAQLDVLAAAATDHDLQWRRLTRLAELDLLDDSDVDALLTDDPNPDAWQSALAARAARPTEAAKAQAWTVVMQERKAPPEAVTHVARSFWRPGQEQLVTPYAERYLDALPTLGESGKMVARLLARAFFPVVGGEDGFSDRLEAAAATDGVSPSVHKRLRELSDRRRRREDARAAG